MLPGLALLGLALLGLALLGLALLGLALLGLALPGLLLGLVLGLAFGFGVLEGLELGLMLPGFDVAPGLLMLVSAPDRMPPARMPRRELEPDMDELPAPALPPPDTSPAFVVMMRRPSRVESGVVNVRLRARKSSLALREVTFFF
jgi:hypothetical protein